MKKQRIPTLTITTVVLLVTGCASNGLAHRPKVNNADIANYEVDLKACQHAAAQDQSLEKTADGAIIGATGGSLVGILSDSVDSLGGAVVGALIGAAGGSLETKKAQQASIIRCMQNFGYNVVAQQGSEN